MAISVTCPSCQSSVHVDESLAGKDILCPSCNERVTVPSFAAGRPEARPAGQREAIEETEERARRRDRDADLPRWSDADDYAMPPARDPARWSATLAGLALVFWGTAILVGVMALLQVVVLAIGLAGGAALGGPGGNPGALAGLGVGMMALGCSVIILGILIYVGLCMCCTVPAETGAKGRVVTVVILIPVTFVTALVFGVVVALQAARRGPAPGVMPFSGPAMLVLQVAAGLAHALIVSILLMFHKAIADYFQNNKLSKMCVWYTILYLAFLFINVVLQIIVLQTNPMAAASMEPLGVAAQVYGMIWLLAMSIWYLFIIRETRRTILEDSPAFEDRREEM